MKKIIIVGAGQIGSRHLQALKAVKTPLDITVFDISQGSLKTAEERYSTMNTSGGKHFLKYTSTLPQNSELIDIAIIATSSGPRTEMTKKILDRNKMRFLVLEKILFQKKKDYDEIDELINKKRVKTWVNCPMRMMPFYSSLKNEFNKSKITYILHGNQSGMATDIIHHIDYISFLTGSTNLKIDPSLLDKKIKPSKRASYLEITGTLIINFDNGSQIIARCDSEENSPKLVSMFSKNIRYIVNEPEAKALVSRSPDWKWHEFKTVIPYQSQLTTVLIEELLLKGSCKLPTFKESKKLHLQTFEPLRKFINTFSKNKFNYYPFT